MHIVEHHDDLAGYYHAVLETVSAPDAVYEGDGGELLAVSKRVGTRVLVIPYREQSASDGFVITAFFISRFERLLSRGILWQKSS